MNESSFQQLEDVVRHEFFPEVDLALRRGCHVSIDSGEQYTFITDAQQLLEELYARYHCELIHSADGYFYLLPRSGAFGERHLSVFEMLVGQALALIYLDPAIVKSGGVTQREAVLTRLAATLGEQTLARILHPKRRRTNDRVAQQNVRKEVSKSLRSLAALGFVQLLDEEKVRLLTPVLRFADHVRGSAEPAAVLQQLMQEGKAASAAAAAAGQEEESDV